MCGVPQILTSHVPIFEYHSPMHKKKTRKARVLLLDRAYRHINFIVKTFLGEAGGFGGKLPPPPMEIDETLAAGL